MHTKLRALIGGLAATLILAGSAQAADSVIVGTFGDPTPMQMAAHEHKFADATGWNIEWRKFSSGSAVIAAMASGDIKLAELGSSPLAIAATQDVDLKVFMIDYVIGQSESLIVRDGAGIKSLADLKGKRVAVPIGSTSHFSLMGALDHAGIGENDLTIMNMQPDQIAAAWQQSAVDAAFIWPPTQTEILKTGKRLVGADETAQWGYPTFNAWVVNREFAESHKDGLIKFMKTFNDANMAYMKDPSAWTPDSTEIKEIADQTGADAKQVPVTIKGYTFIPLKDQLDDKWLGGGLAKSVEATAKFLKSAGRLDHVADDYNKYVTDEYVKSAVQ